MKKPTHSSLKKERGEERKRKITGIWVTVLWRQTGRRVQNYKRAYRVWRTGKESVRERERERERCFLIIQNKIECKFPKQSSSKPRTRQKQTDNLADASWVLPEGSVHNVWLTDKLTAVGSVSGFFPSLQPKDKNNKNQTLSKQIVITNTMPSDLLELNRVQTWNWYLFAAVAKETNKQEWQEWAGEKT